MTQDDRWQARYEEVVAFIEANKRTPSKYDDFNLAIHPSEEMSEDCRGILEGIDGLEFYVKGRMLYWSIGLMSGSYPWSVEVQERIVMQRPKTKREFISLF